MDDILLQARAKINLYLDVINKRPDGYHNVKMIMQQIGLYDEVYIKKEDKGITLETNVSFLPTGEDNIAFKAAKLILERYEINQGVYIHINKRIPIAAGMAGGSTDAAAVIKGLNKIFKLNLSLEKMMELGLTLGADVPFCFLEGCALAEGIGEKLTPIEGLDKGWLVLSKPNMGISTREAYKNLNLDDTREKMDIQVLIEALKSGEIYAIGKSLYNIFEEGIFNRYPMVKDIKDKMLQYGALGSIMTGTGPTVFGIFKDYEKAKSAYTNFLKYYRQTYLVRPYN